MQKDDIAFFSPRKAQNALKKWKKSLCLEKKCRYCCTITGICVCDLNITQKQGFSLVIFNGIMVQAHHIFCFEKYPNLRYDSNNGILLYSIVHQYYHTYHKKYFNNTPVNAKSFLAFCKKCGTDKTFLKELLNKILRNLKNFFSLEHLEFFDICEHPINNESCYRVFLDVKNNAGRRVVLIPCALLDCFTGSNFRYLQERLLAAIALVEKKDYKISFNL